MASKAPAWVVPVMRAGYGARALVYLVVGALALGAVFWGGAAEGTQNALADLRQVTFGTLALWLIGVGLMAYMVWRVIDAAMDLEDRGNGAMGIFARAAQAVTGLIHGALGLSVIGLAQGQASGQGGAENWTARLMSLPYGPSLVAVMGAAVIGAGIYYVQKGLRAKYREDIRITPVTRKLDPAMRLGFVAQGVIVGTIGFFVLYAGLMSDPDQAGGVGQALGHIRAMSYGAFLFAAIAVGLLCFALENGIEAVYRIVPRHAGPNVRSLAASAKAKVKAHAPA